MSTEANAGRNSSETALETGRWILAIGKHLKAFATGPELASLYAISRSALDGELLLRIRGLNIITSEKIRALALDVGIPRQEVSGTLNRLEQVTGLIAIERSRSDQEIQRVFETILTEQEVYRAISDLFEAADPTPVERALIPLLSLMSLLPLTEAEVVSRVCGKGHNEQDVRSALELQEAFRLLQRRHVNDLGVTLIYNEYLWGNKIDRIGSILANIRAEETEGLLALIEEVRAAQGQSIHRLGSAPPHIVKLAAETGIIDTTTIISKSGDARTFAFSPHFYGYRTGSQPAMIEDTSDQVKLFLASMTYGVQYSADFRLNFPVAFVKRLLRDGVAGHATPILRDYILLERQGIVSVEERAPGRGTFVLQKPDVVERALRVMQSGSLLTEGAGSNDARSLVTQRSFRSPELNRITGVSVGHVVGSTDRFQDELLAQIRETAQSGTW